MQQVEHRNWVRAGTVRSRPRWSCDAPAQRNAYGKDSTPAPIAQLPTLKTDAQDETLPSTISPVPPMLAALLHS